MATKKELEPKVNMTAEQSPANADGYSSVWQGKIDDVMKKMEERKPFSYDPESDALYKQHEDRYLSGGRMAMQDTMGQAAAMTGGYGSSYAQSVGQQAHQEYMKGLTDKIPELYQLAYSRYADEGEDLLNQYSLYAGREAQDYSRYLDDRNYNYQLERDAVLDRQWQDNYDQEAARINRENKLADAEIAASLGDYSLYKNLGFDTSNAWTVLASDYTMSDSDEDTLLAYLAKGEETGDYTSAVTYLDVLLEKGVPDNVIDRYMNFIPKEWLIGEGLLEGDDVDVDEDVCLNQDKTPSGIGGSGRTKRVQMTR